MNSTAAAGQSGVVAFNVPRQPERRPAYPIVRIHLLGSMRATSYLGDDVLPRPKKARAILAYLCFAFGRAVPRARLASMLWDRVSDEQARASFRHALSELCAAMGPLAGELISAGRATVRLNTDACWIDVIALLESSSSNSTRSDLAVLCAGELLEELAGTSASFDQWLLRERKRFNEKLKGPLESELRKINEPGSDAKHVAAIARRLTAFDPTHEGASRALMRALASMGERAEALREYDRCREVLRKVLNVAPSSESKGVYEAIRTLSERKNRKNRATAGAASMEHLGATETRQLAPSRGRLRVGVLPFDAISSENEGNLAFSLSHEIAAALSRFRWFDVITPISMMRKPLANFVTEGIRRNQQLDYAVDGIIAQQGKCLNISVRLLDLAGAAKPVWSDRFELALDELHRLNEMVVARIVASIDPVILFIEGQPKRKERYGATGLLFLAIPLIYSMERRKFEQAGDLIKQALEIEPENTMAVTLAAYWHLWHVGQCWTADNARTLSTVETLCLRAMELDPDNSEAMGIYAYTLAWKKEFDRSVRFFDRSLRLNPNLAYIWALSAATYCYIGEPDSALTRLGRYRDLAPLDPYYGFFENAYTIAYTFKRDFERAVVVGRRVVKANPAFINGYKPLIASLGHLGRRDEARPYVEKVLSLEPDFTIEKFAQSYPFKLGKDRRSYCEGLRRAGVPQR